MKDALTIVASGNPLDRDQAAQAMRVIMTGGALPEEIAGFLLGVTSRGPTVDEMAGFAEVMRERAVPVRISDGEAIDLCGTGGDGAGLFNISTAAAFVCAGAGCTVAKHGNRSISSRSGSADVLEALGIEASLPPEGVEYCIEESGIGFIFAPLFHPAMKNVMPVRRALGVRTFFNLLGPLCNPAGVKRQLVGAFSVTAAETIAAVLAELGAEHVIAVHSDDGLDEVSVSAPTSIFEFRRDRDASPRAMRVEPADSGLTVHPLSDIAGGSADENAETILDVLRGNMGAPRDIVLINAAHAIRAAGAADDLESAIAMAQESIDSGAAMGKLTSLRKTSGEAARS